MSETPVTHDDLEQPTASEGGAALANRVIDQINTLRAAGAARFDAVAWHFIEVLAERASTQTGPAQALLYDKLTHALSAWQTRWEAAALPAHPTEAPTTVTPSPLASLLRDMGHCGRASTPVVSTNHSGGWRAESPRIRQFRQQLSKISVQKQVTQAIAQAPQNAGPINSHMLVLRSLAVMRDASPDYLNRFMTYLDTLLCLEEAGKTRLAPKKAAGKTTAKSVTG